MVDGFWTDERVEELRALVAEGTPYAEIGERWGVSKNVPLAKANRLGIAHPNARPTVKTQSLIDRLDALDLFPPPGRCAFPYGDTDAAGFHFCGDAVGLPGFPYCPTHARKAYANASATEAQRQAWANDPARRAEAARQGRLNLRRRSGLAR